MRSVAFVALGVLGLAACGGGGGGGGAASCTPGPSATLTINDSGFPNGANNACVQLAGQVTFVNQGTSAHTINFDTLNCPTTPVALGPSASSTPVPFPNTTINCSFHIDSNTALKGTVAVSSGTVSGGGY